jgi:hypothetical protein
LYVDCFIPPHFKIPKNFKVSSFEGHGEIKKNGCTLGFHCGCKDDLLPAFDNDDNNSKTYRNMEYAIEKCKYLAEQIVEAHEPYG